MRCNEYLDCEQHSENVQDRVDGFPFAFEDFHQRVGDESECDACCDA